LTKVESVFPEETMAISGAEASTPATCTHNSPPIASVCTSVPEQHSSMPTTFKHLKFHKMPASALVSRGLAIAPAMQAIIVDSVPIVNPQLAPIIRDNAEPVMGCPEDSQAASPTHSKVIALSESRPFAACVAIVDSMSPASHVRFTSIQVLASATLAKVEGIFPEKSSAINGTMTALSHATCTRNSPTISSIGTMVPELHPSMTTMLKHLDPHNAPPSANMSPGCSAAPAMQAIIVNCVPIVKPELASII
jgi:hypothetical protein